MDNEQAGGLRNLWILSGAVVVILFVTSIYTWTQAPAGTEVCTNWAAAGECDTYSNKFLTLFSIPILVTAVVVLLAVFLRSDPRKAHVFQSRKGISVVVGTMLLTLLAVQIIVLAEVLGRDPAAGSYWQIIAGLLLIVVGNYLGKIRSNGAVGIRTPWTLASELSWNKTHRLGGKLLVLIGIFLMAGSLIMTGDVWFYLVIGMSLLWMVIVVIYSYLIWKEDPDISIG